MNINSVPQLSASPDLAGNRRGAVQVGIDDIGASRFRSFDTPEALVQHLQELGADILDLGKTHLRFAMCLAPRITPNFSESHSIRK
jgi:hypothetical protein